MSRISTKSEGQPNLGALSCGGGSKQQLSWMQLDCKLGQDRDISCKALGAASRYFPRPSGRRTTLGPPAEVAKQTWPSSRTWENAALRVTGKSLLLLPDPGGSFTTRKARTAQLAPGFFQPFTRGFTSTSTTGVCGTRSEASATSAQPELIRSAAHLCVAGGWWQTERSKLFGVWLAFGPVMATGMQSNTKAGTRTSCEPWLNSLYKDLKPLQSLRTPIPVPV